MKKKTQKTTTTTNECTMKQCMTVLYLHQTMPIEDACNVGKLTASGHSEFIQLQGSLKSEEKYEDEVYSCTLGCITPAKKYMIIWTDLVACNSIISILFFSISRLTTCTLIKCKHATCVFFFNFFFSFLINVLHECVLLNSLLNNIVVN